MIKFDCKYLLTYLSKYNQIVLTTCIMVVGEASNWEPKSHNLDGHGFILTLACPC